MEKSTNMAPLIGRDWSKQLFCGIDTWNCLSQSERFKTFLNIKPIKQLNWSNYVINN